MTNVDIAITAWKRISPCLFEQGMFAQATAFLEEERMPVEQATTRRQEAPPFRRMQLFVRTAFVPARPSKIRIIRHRSIGKT